jgi:hypothetical protein
VTNESAHEHTQRCTPPGRSAPAGGGEARAHRVGERLDRVVAQLKLLLHRILEVLAHAQLELELHHLELHHLIGREQAQELDSI